MLDIRPLLGISQIYRFFVRAIRQRRDLYVKDYVQTTQGQRILDIGCGPGDVLEYLPDVDYVGVDHNPDYIASAIARFGKRGSFLCCDASEVVIGEPHSFDIVMANGLIHHLSDHETDKLLQIAKQALKPSGYLVTYDGCYLPKQSPIVRLLLSLDRGKHVRREHEYRSLISKHFGKYDVHIRSDMYSIPYTIIVMVAYARESAPILEPSTRAVSTVQ